MLVACGIVGVIPLTFGFFLLLYCMDGLNLMSALIVPRALRVSSAVI